MLRDAYPYGYYVLAIEAGGVLLQVMLKLVCLLHIVASKAISTVCFKTNAVHFRSPTDVTKEEYKTISEKLDKVVLDDTINKSLDDETESPHEAPAGVPDFDQENWNDQFQVSNYAMDIFNYLKGREVGILRLFYSIIPTASTGYIDYSISTKRESDPYRKITFSLK